LPSNGRSGGILCGFKIEKFDKVKIVEHEFAMEAEVWDKEMKKHLRMGTIYGPAHEERKEQFLVELSNICSKNNLPMLVGGDFNILRFSSKKTKHYVPTDIPICSTGSLTLMGCERLTSMVGNIPGVTIS
jgi:hypothetical protein